MFHVIDDARISGYRPLISPAILMEEIPGSEQAAKLIANARSGTEAIIRGEDDRLLVVAGPCSIHDTQAALEYADHLHGALDDLKSGPLYRHAGLFRKAAHDHWLERLDQPPPSRWQLRHQ